MVLTSGESFIAESELEAVRCPICGHLLLKLRRGGGMLTVEVRCRRCGKKIAVSLAG